MPVRIFETNEEGLRFEEIVILPNGVENRITYKDSKERDYEIKRALKTWLIQGDVEAGDAVEYTPVVDDTGRSDFMPESFYDAEDSIGHDNRNHPDVP